MKNQIIHTYHIGGMSCDGCVSTVHSKLSALPEVTSVKVDLAKKEVEITSSVVIKSNTLQDALNNTQYTIEELRVA